MCVYMEPKCTYEISVRGFIKSNFCCCCLTSAYNVVKLRNHLYKYAFLIGALCILISGIAAPSINIVLR